MLAIWVDLHENGPWLFVVAEAGIDNEGVGPISSWVVNNWLRAKVGLEFLESLQCIRWQLAAFPRTVFFV
jgi:hypothetical protein